MRHPALDYSTPKRFTPRERGNLLLASGGAAYCLHAIAATCREDTIDAGYLDAAMAKRGCVILGFWHETLGLAAWHFRDRGYHTLTSYSFDGELAARVVGHFDIQALRGSSSRGGHAALKQMRKALDLQVTIGITLDGPKGPRREAKAGAVLLAAQTGTPILPVALATKPAWRLKSWDRMMVPVPLGRITALYGPPIYVEREQSSETLERARQDLQAKLTSLQQDLETRLGLKQAAG